AERCVAGGAPPTVISGPEVGMVMMTVREPIAHERFHADVIQLGRLTEQLELDRAEAEWDDFGPTRVNFNEID
ncbi:MAG: hypothetical protein JJE52_06390, partial [Acidimicrobiia bacterium]|nr:hypothetical protein [Acidimicrobiia bacterium]